MMDLPMELGDEDQAGLPAVLMLLGPGTGPVPVLLPEPEPAWAADEVVTSVILDADDEMTWVPVLLPESEPTWAADEVVILDAGDEITWVADDPVASVISGFGDEMTAAAGVAVLTG